MAKQQDANLWRGYAQALTNHWPWGVDQNEGIWVPQVSSVGIPAGSELPESAQNAAAKRAGDLLLDTKQPVAALKGGSYYKAVSQIPLWTQIDTSQSPQAQQAIENAQNDLIRAQEQYDRGQKDALKDFSSQKRMGIVQDDTGFQDWAVSNSPRLQMLSQQEQQTAQQLSQTITGISSEEASRLKDLTNRVSQVRSGRDLPGVTMKVKDVSTKEIQRGSSLTGNDTIEPLYTISKERQSLNEAFQDWKAKAKNPSAEGVVFSFTSNTTASDGKNWAALGFPDGDGIALQDHCVFIRAGSDNDDERVETISAAESDGEIKVQIKAVGTEGFDVSRGKWDIDQLSDYPLRSNAPESLRNGLVRVQKVFVGYGLSMEIELPASLCFRAKRLLSKASQDGGYVSFLGFKVTSGNDEGPSTATFDQVEQDSDDTHIRIRTQNNNLPVALALHGRKLLAKMA